MRSKEEETSGLRSEQKRRSGSQVLIACLPAKVHPSTSGRSPDSRFNGLAAFPTRRSVALWPALRDHSGGAVPDFHRLPY
jgi:hypothetical protein